MAAAGRVLPTHSDGVGGFQDVLPHERPSTHHGAPRRETRLSLSVLASTQYGDVSSDQSFWEQVLKFMTRVVEAGR